jgi:glucosamine-6-phosphate deaminase
MFNNFFKHIDILPENAHLLDGNAPDLEKECEEYEKQIKEAGGIELFLGGICYLFIVTLFCVLVR